MNLLDITDCFIDLVANSKKHANVRGMTNRKRDRLELSDVFLPEIGLANL